MSPLLTGVFASSRLVNTYTPVGSYDSLATVTVPSGGLSSITFAGIPTGYRHLQVRGIARTNDTGSFNNQQLRFNNDSSSVYSFHTLFGDGSSATASSSVTQTSFNDFFRAGGTGISSSIFGIGIVDILDYASISKFKTCRNLIGGDANGSGIVGLVSGLYQSINPITSITLNPSGGTFSQYSTFSLYGVK